MEAHHQSTYSYQKHADWTIQGHCLQVQFIGAHLDQFTSLPSKKQSTYYNYYLSDDPKTWQSKIPAYKSLAFKEIYPGIDLKVHSSNNSFKYDLIVEPEANAEVIQLSYKGADKIYLQDGHLHIQNSVNELIEQAPYAYQYIEGVKREVACRYILEDDDVRYSFPNGYNKSQALIIDPFIVFSRYSSSSANNFGYTATYDSEGNAYGAGSVFNIGYITTPGAYDISFNGASTDIGITKYTSDGLNKIYATYLGGAETELPHSIVVNSRNELFCWGQPPHPISLRATIALILLLQAARLAT